MRDYSCQLSTNFSFADISQYESQTCSVLEYVLCVHPIYGVCVCVPSLLNFSFFWIFIIIIIVLIIISLSLSLFRSLFVLLRKKTALCVLPIVSYHALYGTQMSRVYTSIGVRSSFLIPSFPRVMPVCIFPMWRNKGRFWKL